MRRSVGMFFLLAGCAGKPAQTAVNSPAGTPHIDVPRIVVTPTETLSVEELFAAGRAAGERGDWRTAAGYFDRLVAVDPEGALTPEALFLAGEAYDVLFDHSAALARYEAVATRYPESRRAPEAAVRGVRLSAYDEQWEWAGRFADRALARLGDLTSLQQIAAYAGKALQNIAAGDDVRASGYVERGRNIVERQGFDLAGRLPIELAPLYYALGEVRRLRADRIHFDAPEQFPARMEARCQLILDAQSAYSDSWRAYDSHWSLLSGVRVGRLYDDLHRELMATMRPPDTADTDDRRLLYYGATRLLYSVLLEKARGMIEHTLTMAEREREHSPWVERARATLVDIHASEREEDAALARLPYTRAELEDALAQIRADVRAKNAKSTAGGRAGPKGTR